MKQPTKYTEIAKEDFNNEKFKTSLHASHCMIYAINHGKIVLEDEYSAKANILMQMRFDGHLGFPGGLVDDGETPEEAVTREMEEEMAMDRRKLKISAEDHVISHYCEEKDLVLHLFAKEVSLSLFIDIEKTCLKSHDYGSEVMGIMRVPLYTMIDGYRGFPAFLRNCFIGNCKEQLIYTLILKGIMTTEEINKSLEAKPSA